MKWIKDNPWKSLFIALAVIYVVVSLFRKTWNPVNWFGSAASSTTTTTTTTTTGDGSAPLSDTIDAMKKSLQSFQINGTLK